MSMEAGLAQTEDCNLHDLCSAYWFAKRRVTEEGFRSEITWQQDVRLASITEPTFLSEAAWVVLSAGMRERIVRRVFPGIAAAFLGWSSARNIVQRSDHCVRSALQVFHHERKIRSIVGIAKHVADVGLDGVRRQLVSEGAAYLQVLPYIGPVTCHHLAKNLGLRTAKADRHLTRIAAAAGYSCPIAMCDAIAAQTGDSVSVVDIVLWRFATMCSSYERLFSFPAW